MKKFTQIVMATLIASSTYVNAATLTLHGQEQSLAEYGGPSQDTPFNVLHKNVRVTFYNPNNFNVNIRLNTHQRELDDQIGNFSTSTAAPETITINANSGYIYEPSTSGANLPSSLLDLADTRGGRMCDLDMYQSIIRIDDTYLTCATLSTRITISWQDSLLRNGDSSIKTVAPITGVLDYYYSRETNGETRPE